MFRIRKKNHDIAQPPRRRFWLRLALALKLAFVSGLVLVTGGPSVEAQVDDSPASFFRLDRQRMQNRAAARPQRKVIQRPTRMIRGARPQRGFATVAPRGPIEFVRPRAPGAGTAVAPPASIAAPPAGPVAEPPKTAILKPDPAPALPAGPQTRIAVLGDNVGQFLARGLETTFAERPDIAIVRLTRDSSGLVNVRFYDWIEEAKKLLASGQKVDIAIVMLGSNDNQEIATGGERLAARSEGWNKVYRQRVEALAAQFRAKNIPLIWVGQPVMRNARLSDAMFAYNQLYRDAVTRAGGVYIDIWEAFIDDRNRLSLFGPDINGQIVKLRTGDGVHFTPAGARKLAHFTETALRRQIDAIRRRQDPSLIALPAAPPARAGVPGQPGAPAALPPGEKPQLQAALPQPGGPPAPVLPKPEPVRPAAGPVVRLLAPELSSGGELVTRRLNPGAAAKDLPSVVRRTLTTGVPGEARSGRADDFSWPKNLP